MRYYALACDYDGTIAHHGEVDAATLTALMRLKDTGRRLILVTGRELDDLKRTFPKLEIFDRVVAEDGALLYHPETREEKPLGAPPPPEFLEGLRNRGVTPLSAGRVIVATWEPHSHAVLDLIREMGLEYQVIFNKGAVMVLPSGLNKAVGLKEALKELGLSRHNVVAVGDAQNDHAFLSISECAVAVANALQSLKQHADLVTESDHGRGVAELVEKLVKSDLAELGVKLERHDMLLGNTETGAAVRVPPYGANILLAGTSGGGKSTIATSFMERLTEQEFQYCIIDPEGDYADFEGSVAVGDHERSPSIPEVLRLLEKGQENCAVNLLGIRLEDRPPFFESLLHAIMEVRARTGRPHWLVIDESHHLFPASWSSSPLALPRDLQGMMLITVHPEYVARPVLTLVDTVIAIGENPRDTISSFAASTFREMPEVPERHLQRGEAVIWETRKGRPFLFRTVPPRAERRRHLRKYAEGELPPNRSFWFRGPLNRLNLRAQNLRLFLQIADGVDDETWLYHLRQGDYSTWFRDMIKDRKVAEEVELLEERELTAEEGRQLIRKIVEEHYTGAA